MQPAGSVAMESRSRGMLWVGRDREDPQVPRGCLVSGSLLAHQSPEQVAPAHNKKVGLSFGQLMELIIKSLHFPWQLLWVCSVLIKNKAIPSCFPAAVIDGFTKLEMSWGCFMGSA